MASERYSVKSGKMCSERYSMETGRSSNGKTKRLTLALIIVLVIAIIFAVLFAVFYIKYNDDDDDDNDSGKVCLSQDCVDSASYLNGIMDLNADPCDDFFLFVCGKMVNTTVIPSSKTEVDVFGDLLQDSEDFYGDLFDKGIQKGDLDYVKKMKNYYASCLDEDKIEEVGLIPYFETGFPVEWPTLNSDWENSTFDLKDVTERYSSMFVESLFSYTPVADPMNSSRYILQISQPSLCLSLNEMQGNRSTPQMKACEQYYVDIARALNAVRSVATEDAKYVIDFQTELAKIAVLFELVKNNSEMYNPTTLGQMNKDYPYIDWHRTFVAVFKKSGIPFDPSMVVDVEFPKYFDSLKTLLPTVNVRVIQNKYAFDNAVRLVGSLTKATRTAKLNLNKVLYGVKEEEPRWQQCVKQVASKFGVGLSKQFVNEKFPPESKAYVTKMVHLVKETFKEQIKVASWMEATTKDEALFKLKLMIEGVGYPDENFDEDYINRLYETVKVNVSNYYQTRKDLSDFTYIRQMKDLMTKVNNNDWGDRAMTVNAFRRSAVNAINLFAGILQHPFYSAKFPSSLNYGAIGNVIGHELSHAFDLRGSQFDAYGQLKNWWTPDDGERFDKKMECLIDQYSKFYVKQAGLYINGNLSVQENAGDTGGDIVAYKAYKKFAATQPKELPLPGLGLTPDQQVFVGIGQVHCSKIRTAALRNQIMSQVHPPGQIRVNGPLKNSYDFAKAFNCPVGSPMNPKDKCVIW